MTQDHHRTPLDPWEQLPTCQLLSSLNPGSLTGWSFVNKTLSWPLLIRPSLNYSGTKLAWGLKRSVRLSCNVPARGLWPRLGLFEQNAPYFADKRGQWVRTQSMLCYIDSHGRRRVMSAYFVCAFMCVSVCIWRVQMRSIFLTLLTYFSCLLQMISIKLHAICNLCSLYLFTGMFGRGVEGSSSDDPLMGCFLWRTTNIWCTFSGLAHTCIPSEQGFRQWKQPKGEDTEV